MSERRGPNGTFKERTISNRGRILVVIPGEVGERPTGPQIRGWGIARALAGRFDVTVASHGSEPKAPDAVRVVPACRWKILREALQHDVVIAPWLQPFLIPLLRARGVALVSDLYDPVEIEVASAAHRGIAAELASLRRLTDLQLRFADVITCGGIRQREHLLRSPALGRRSHGHPPVLVVPFGLPEPPRAFSGHPLREALALGSDDSLVFWWGSLWRWFDPETAIDAVASLAKRRANIKLVFSAGRPPDPASQALVKTEEVRAHASRLGVLGTSVHMLELWIPYDERSRYLRDADVGLTLHASDEEAELAVRARYLDYLWCGLPCVLSAGDEMADELAASGLARLVRPGSISETEAALDSLLGRPTLRDAAGEASHALRRRFRWEAVTEPLAVELEGVAAGARSRRLRPTLAALVPVARFYLRRLADLAAVRLSRAIGGTGAAG